MNIVHRQGCWIVVAAALSVIAYPVTDSAAEDGRFEKLSVYLERNVQDHDAEIRFEVTGVKDGLASLRVLAPDGRTVIDVRTPDSKLGIRGLILESPEPADDEGPVPFPELDDPATRLRGLVGNHRNRREKELEPALPIPLVPDRLQEGVVVGAEPFEVVRDVQHGLLQDSPWQSRKVMSSRPARPFPSRNGWIVSNCACASPILSNGGRVES